MKALLRLLCAAVWLSSAPVAASTGGRPNQVVAPLVAPAEQILDDRDVYSCAAPPNGVMVGTDGRL